MKWLMIGLGIMVICLTVIASMALRWVSAKVGYQEYTYVETAALYTRARYPIPGASYFFNDMYKVTYQRGRWPFIKKVSVYMDRKFVVRNPE